jgi:hypothetical protein
MEYQPYKFLNFKIMIASISEVFLKYFVVINIMRYNF